MRLGRFCIALAGAAMLLPASAQASSWRYVKGHYAQAATCVPSDGGPTASPTVWEFECASGTTTWTGDLQGQTVLSNVRGTIDLLTGITRGTADETIHLIMPGGRTETLDMTSVFYSNSENHFAATNKILDGSGDFAGAKGTLVFTGMTIGAGEYSGWIKTKSKKARRTPRR